MTITIYWEPTLFLIIISALWIFRDITLILYARTMKKRGTQSKFNNLLFIMGIIFLVWNVILFFLPGMRLTYFIIPDESELSIFFTYMALYDCIPIIIEVFLGISLSLYFYNRQNSDNKKILVGPVLYLLGQIILLFFIFGSDFLYVFEYDLFENTYEVFLLAYVVISCIPVVGIFFIFLYSIYQNKDYLIMFCGLLFAAHSLSLVYMINNAIAYFNYLFRYGL